MAQLRPLRLSFVSFGPRRVTQGQERGRPRPTGWALALRGESGRIGEGSELPTNHSRPRALGWERGCGGRDKNSRGRLTYHTADRRCKPLQDKRASRDPVSPGRDGPIGLGPSAQCAGPHPRPHSRTTWGGPPAGGHPPTPELSAIPFRTEPAPNTRARGESVERTRRDRFDNPSPGPGVSEGAAQGSRRRTRSMRLPGRWRRPTLPHSAFAAGPRCKSGPPRGRTWLRARWPTPRLRRTPSNRASELVLRPEGWRVDGRPCA